MQCPQPRNHSALDVADKIEQVTYNWYPVALEDISMAACFFPLGFVGEKLNMMKMMTINREVRKLPKLISQ